MVYGIGLKLSCICRSHLNKLLADQEPADGRSGSMIHGISGAGSETCQLLTTVNCACTTSQPPVDQHWQLTFTVDSLLYTNTIYAYAYLEITTSLKNPTWSIDMYYLKNNCAKFHHDPIWNDRSLRLFLRASPNKNNNCNNSPTSETVTGSRPWYSLVPYFGGLKLLVHGQVTAHVWFSSWHSTATRFSKLTKPDLLYLCNILEPLTTMC